MTTPLGAIQHRVVLDYLRVSKLTFFGEYHIRQGLWNQDREERLKNTPGAKRRTYDALRSKDWWCIENNTPQEIIDALTFTRYADPLPDPAPFVEREWKYANGGRSIQYETTISGVPFQFDFHSHDLVNIRSLGEVTFPSYRCGINLMFQRLLLSDGFASTDWLLGSDDSFYYNQVGRMGIRINENHEVDVVEMVAPVLAALLAQEVPKGLIKRLHQIEVENLLLQAYEEQQEKDRELQEVVERILDLYNQQEAINHEDWQESIP